MIDDKGFEYNVTTDYEDFTPIGKERVYNLELTEEEFTADGTVKDFAKLINKEYPGTLIEACWGDTLVVNVKNSMARNGTSMHWHGIRQLGTNHMDGVNAVTQCPTNNGETFQYKFKLQQYGHTWYHSHYSSQYSDGVAGPLLIHGPNSDDWDVEWPPLMISDWLHNTAFQEFNKELFGPGLPAGDSIVVNGTGRFNGKGDYYKNTFEPGKRYLIRIINASTGLHFHFSIDNHILKVVSTDLVPIEPYTTESISVGIGQRYSVIVEAKPTAKSNDGKYWLRTEYVAGFTGCNAQLRGVDPSKRDNMRTGIISYTDATGTSDPSTSGQTSVTIGCKDEAEVRVLVPKVKWNITSPPQNDVDDYVFEAGQDQNATGKHFGVRHWSITNTPMWLNFSDPTLLNLDNAKSNPEYAVVDYNFRDGDKWVYMVITSGSLDSGIDKSLGGTHPIHLHGHDFVILAQNTTKYDRKNSPKYFKTDNPPRRDVAMLPGGGYLAIAFKPDNPGVWLLHCHIAWHAGSGLALQIMERQDEIASTLGTTAINQVQDGCKKWDDWLDATPSFNLTEVQEDSGI
ncbi:multicopper oxidase-domain-containing protein [Lophiotrema nucula]|uniref:Multicopper oxidase-domain-containing protein n=1 Tax=Lophiotrema nucula TaxID=690887 RepID=A0A6A5YY40_9PLEO|nr:multicopper oxidase-domain-containing protein [Lophiotrema nucula]